MEKKENKNYRRDLLLVVVLVLIAISALFLTGHVKEKAQYAGAVAVVSVDGAESGRYPLNTDGVFSLNGGTNILVIEDGEAWVSEANCPDQICMGMGKISHNDEFIACLPNRVLIVIEGGEDTGLDATT